MRKTLLTLLAAVMMTGGCSYFSWMNPWADDKKPAATEELPVNEFLWRAALERMSFTPLKTENPSKGLIVTDWFRMEGYPRELFMVKVQVLTKELRSNGIKVSVEKRVLKDGKWYDVEAGSRLQSAMEDRILLKARELYRASLYK